ncbi:MAG: dephospho-CoA kinase [Deltaproteobacteria bacterium]|nr:dephospho-CoA kinase [Deltaproteobacteria bacterium]
MFKRVKGNDDRLVIGVTGSIATGKSTVAVMLEEMGAPIVDCDLLSRLVVEPGKPAWEDIVSFFGEEVLLEDKTLNRKKLGEIVFQDAAKRKKLESIQHIRILEEMAQLVEEHVERDPNAIVQGVVPLLIEVSWQPAFHKLLMVYVPEEEQVKRLMERDNIDQEMAMKIIRSQMGVDEKKGHCDYIIDNSGSLEETRKQTAELWENLLKIQQDRKG